MSNTTNSLSRPLLKHYIVREISGKDETKKRHEKERQKAKQGSMPSPSEYHKQKKQERAVKDSSQPILENKTSEKY